MMIMIKLTKLRKRCSSFHGSRFWDKFDIGFSKRKKKKIVLKSLFRSKTNRLNVFFFVFAVLLLSNALKPFSEF